MLTSICQICLVMPAPPQFPDALFFLSKVWLMLSSFALNLRATFTWYCKLPCFSLEEWMYMVTLTSQRYLVLEIGRHQLPDKGCGSAIRQLGFAHHPHVDGWWQQSLCRAPQGPRCHDYVTVWLPCAREHLKGQGRDTERQRGVEVEGAHGKTVIALSQLH